VLETKGFDELADIKAQAAGRWVRAVNADGRFGAWRYAVARKPGEVSDIMSRRD
jgi:type III restriction enzyme